MTSTIAESATTALPPMSATDSMRYQAGLTRFSVDVNVKDVTHEESLIQPQPAGNCMNWVLGHLLAIYAKVLPQLHAEPVISWDRIKRYDRGSPPLVNPAEAIPFNELLEAWTETCNRIDAGLAHVPAEALQQRVLQSPSGNPDETVNSLLFTVMFHQAYHAGQLGVLRRLIGKEGAIK